MDRQRARILSIISTVMMVGGLIIIYLVRYGRSLTVEYHEYNTTTTSSETKSVEAISGRLWLFSLGYIIPGIIGDIAAIFQRRYMYVITCIVAMISLLVMAIAIVYVGLGLILYIAVLNSMSEFCVDSDDGCMCRFDEGKGLLTSTQFETCSRIGTVVTIVTILIALTILTWLALLALSIVSCYFSCRSTSTTGTVIIPAQQAMLYQGQEMGPPSYNYGNSIPDKV